MDTKAAVAVAIPDRSLQRDSLLGEANSLTITNSETYRKAGNLLLGVVGLRKQIEEDFAPAIEAAHQAHKAALAGRNKHVQPLIDVENVLRRKCGDFQASERKRIEDEQRKAREAAEAEARRVREEQAKAEEAERKRREEEAFEAACNGDVEKVQELISEPIVVAPVAPQYVPPPIVAAPKVAGLGTREVWSAEVVDLHELIKYAASCPKAMAESLLAPSLSTLNSLARNAKASFAIPGCKAVSTTTTSVR